MQRLRWEECVRLLAQNTLGRVCVTISALPAVRTVRYAITPGYVVFRAAPGSRLLAAAADTVIAFHTDHDCQSDGVGWTVQVQGICEQITNPAVLEELRALRLPAWSHGNDAFLRLPLETVSGELVHWNEPYHQSDREWQER